MVTVPKFARIQTLRLGLCAQRGNWGSEWRRGALNGEPPRSLMGMGRTGGNPFLYGIWGEFSATPAALFRIQRSAQHRNRKMCQKRRIIIQLDPAHHAVILQILRHLRLTDFEVLRQFSLKS